MPSDGSSLDQSQGISLTVTLLQLQLHLQLQLQLQLQVQLESHYGGKQLSPVFRHLQDILFV